MGGFPHKCQLAAKGISIHLREDRWSTSGAAQVRSVIHIFGISPNSELMRIHNYLMIFFKIIFNGILVLWGSGAEQ